MQSFNNNNKMFCVYVCTTRGKFGNYVTYIQNSSVLQLNPIKHAGCILKDMVIL